MLSHFFPAIRANAETHHRASDELEHSPWRCDRREAPHASSSPRARELRISPQEKRRVRSPSDDRSHSSSSTRSAGSPSRTFTLLRSRSSGDSPCQNARAHPRRRPAAARTRSCTCSGVEGADAATLARPRDDGALVGRERPLPAHREPRSSYFVIHRPHRHGVHHGSHRRRERDRHACDARSHDVAARAKRKAISATPTSNPRRIGSVLPLG